MDENNGIMESTLPLLEKGPWDPSAFILTMGFTFHKLI